MSNLLQMKLYSNKSSKRHRFSIVECPFKLCLNNIWFRNRLLRGEMVRMKRGYVQILLTIPFYEAQFLLSLPLLPTQTLKPPLPSCIKLFVPLFFPPLICASPRHPLNNDVDRSLSKGYTKWHRIENESFEDSYEVVVKISREPLPNVTQTEILHCYWHISEMVS